jgi:hypothetical protein
VSEASVEAVQDSLSDDEEQARAQLDAAFDQFERKQPTIAAFVGTTLSEPLDDTALALGYFLALAVWMAFDHAHADRVGQVSDEQVSGTQELLDLDEELRRSDPTEPLDSDDIVAMEQPALLSFIHEHVDAALGAHADTIDVDDVQVIYRTILIEVLTLSYAVAQPAGFPASKAELMA